MGTTQCTKQAVGLIVAAQGNLCLNISKTIDKSPLLFLDTSISPDGLFSSAVAAMQAHCKSKKKKDEAFSCHPLCYSFTEENEK